MKSKQIGRDRTMDSQFAKMLDKNLATQSQLTPGEHVRASIISIDDANYVFIKTEFGRGMIEKKQLSDQDGNLLMGVGEKLDTFFLETRHGESIYTTVPEGAVRKTILNNACASKTPLRGVITRTVKGGVEVSIGDVTAFCPASCMAADAPAPGQNMLFIITEVNGRNIIASNRAYADLRKEALKKDLQAELQIDDIVTGHVSSLQRFGAFVDIGGIEGLIPINELSFKRVAHPSEVLQLNQEVRVKVINMDWKENRISLSLKALAANPWQGQLPFQINDIIEAEVESIKPFGIFFRLPDNFNGLVPNAESGVERGKSLDKEYSVKQKLRVMITGIDRQREKISLSIKRVKDADIRREYENYMNDSSKDPEEESISSFGLALQASLKKGKN